MKKMLIASIAVFAFALVVTPAFADSTCCTSFPGFDFGTKCCPTITISSSNNANIGNTISSWSNTGKNVITGVKSFWETSSGSIGTGAATAIAGASTTAGSNMITVGTVAGPVTVNSSNQTTLSNVVKAGANTGKNSIVGGGTISTGDAGSQSSAMNVVGSNVISVEK